ncbi:PAS domain S-box protein [Halovenus sp. WSH3]|uniref:histidine kinase n=1 Tax=Halovenus carboxidivorans TaxID=2692199 RepID=A0A6B0T0X9_9EURY|nr:PAS domain-containing sensor histidine kinase [Halovenus carboxidivorans]MXR50847.1 PAS domain S-box protein [Halovenus carboxidivorans]
MSLEEGSGLSAEYDALQTGIALYDPSEATVMDANERFESILGYSVDRLRTLSVDRYTANTGAFAEPDFEERLRAAAAGEPQQFKWRIKRADGTLIWVRVNLSQRTDGETVLAEMRDITDYYTASRRETLFWRILRHNLRNETSVIAGHAGTIRSTTECAEIRRSAAVIESTAVELGDIASEVKQIQRATTRSESDRSTVEASAAVEAVVTDLSEAYPEAEITVERRRQMWIRVDEAFEHALGHAVENAVVHGDDSPRVEISIGPSPNTGRVEIRIADRNPQIPEMEIEALGEFAEVTSTTHGTGVGLFVMKWCIESLGGEIEFERRDDGNVVHIYLPPEPEPSSA